MKQNKKQKRINLLSRIFLFFTILILLGSVSYAFYPLPKEDMLARMDLISRIKYQLAHTGAFTIVNDATCSTYPEEQGYTGSSSKRIGCPYTTPENYGCSVDIWKGQYNSYVGQKHLDPNEFLTISADQTWEMYYCQDKECQCYTEYSGGCGGWTCADDEMYRYRSCTPDKCSWEQTCISGYSSCEPDVPTPDCSSGQTKCSGIDDEYYYTCSNGNWKNQGQVNGKCGYVTPVTPTPDETICCEIDVIFEGRPNKHEYLTQSECDGKAGRKVSDDACEAGDLFITVYKVEPTKSEVNPGEEVEVQFWILNPTSKTEYGLNVECAVYPKEFVTSEGYVFSVYGREGAKEITSCSGEGFVDSLQINALYEKDYLELDDKSFILKPKAPTTTSKFKDGSSAWDGLEKEYAVLCGYYKKCEEGYVSYKMSTIKVTGTDLTTTQHYECVGTTLVTKDGACPTESCPTTQAECLSGGGETGPDGEIITKGCAIPWLNPYSSILTTSKTCSESYTKKEYAGKSETEILNTVCEQAGNCKSRGDDYTTPECKSPDSVSVKIMKNPFQAFLDQFKTARPGVCVVTSTKGIDFGEPYCLSNFCLPIWQWILGVVVIVILISFLRKGG